MSKPEKSAVFSAPSTIRFRDSDPAGIAFFAHAYDIAHDAYEDWVQHLGFSWPEWFNHSTWAAPIRHSSCEHLRPMMPGKKEYQTKVWLSEIGESSFTIKYSIEQEGTICSEVQLVHVFIDRQKRAKLEIPSEIRRRLQAYQSECLSSK